MSLFVPDAVLREVLVSLCVAGAVLGEGEVSLFVSGAIFGEVQVSLLVAGAVFGAGLNVRLAARCCILQEKMLVVSSKSNLGCEAGCGLFSCSDHGRIILGSWSDHGRIGPALEMTFHLFLEIFFEILQCHFSWQAQYLVRFDGDTSCSAHCK